MTVIQIWALRRINNPKVLQCWLFFVCTVCALCYLSTCVVLLVRVVCLFPLHDVLTPTERKRYGWSAVTLSLAPPRWRRPRACKIYTHSLSCKIVLSSITFKPVWWHNTTSDKRSQLLTVYWNVNQLHELEVEQNCASLGCLSADTLFWQVSIDHKRDVQYQRSTR